MRKLTYDIFTKKGAFVMNVTTYAEAEEAKEKGYITKTKLVDIMPAKPRKINKKVKKA